MKEGADFHSPPPPDDPHDPLLAALRQHLGENFGQEPPAALWAGIRQQLPGAPRPWWRSRRLLPLLALLVGIVALGVFSARQNGWLGGQLATRSTTPHHTTTARTQSVTASKKTTAGTSLSASKQAGSKPLAATASTAPVSPHIALGARLAPSTTAANQAATAAGRADVRTAASIAATASSKQPSATTHKLAAVRAGEATATPELGRRSRHLATLRRAQPHASTSKQHRAGSLAAPSFAEAPGTSAQPAATSAAVERGAYSSANSVAASGSSRKRKRRHSAQATSLPATSAADLNTDLGSRSTATLSNRSAHAVSSANKVDMVATSLPTALDSLASRRATLLLATPGLPTALAPTADTPTPWLPPARRWSVLVLAGPTLSFRTARSATTGGLVAAPSAATPTQSYFNSSGSRVSSANVVDLERPAAGLGAQVQVRRVLAGRWALAFGAGYQEYATRLALRVTKRYLLAQPLPTSNVSYTDSSFSVHHRDTYQLVTLPLQLSYLLAPHGRLSLGLMGGVEPSFYVGGRTTEGTSCNCEQQSFSSASGSPYASFSLGLSLGLDARYRLGGPASHWQWVLQPTGRYVASPFVRSNTLFARRQPYSLGLLTGLAWEF